MTGDSSNEPSGVVSSVEVEYERGSVKIMKEMDMKLNGEFALELDNVVCGCSLMFLFQFRENFKSSPLRETVVLQDGRARREIEFVKNVSF